MKTNVKPLVAILLSLVMIMSFSLAGCGSSDNGSDGKTFTVAVTQEIDSLNPLSAWLEVSHEALLLMYDPLVRYDKNLEPEPCLAESWEVSPDQLTWTFHLVKDVKWSDGEPFTSKDVKFTYEFYKENDSYLYSSYLSDMDNIKCPDDNTLVIVTKEPKANMLMNTSPIVPEHIWKDVKDPYNWANAKPVGTGPFIIAKNEPAKE
ncbi:MAG: ABC transporter substrate-binding protein, partial [Lachnospiraceae bacterium]